MDTPRLSVHRVVVLCGASFVAFFNFGIMQSYGCLFSATLERFDEGRSKTSWIHSVLIGTTFGAGAVSGQLIKKYNLTLVSGIGSVLLPLGFIASYFAKSVVYLIVSIGIFSGIGISFSYVSAVVVVSRVVSEKHWTFALSIQNVACGLPGNVLPYLLNWLTEQYHLVGTLLIYGGITLNNIAVTILFSGIKDKRNKTDKNKMAVEESGNPYLRASNAHMFAEQAYAIQQRLSKRNGVETPSKAIIEEPRNDSHSQKMTYILFLIAVSLIMPNIGGFQAISQDLGVFKGLSSDQVLSLIVAFNVSGTIGRFLPALFQKCSENPFILSITAALCGVAGQIIIHQSSQYIYLMIGYALTGVTDGATSASVSVVIFRLLGPKTQSVGFGLALTTIGLLAIGSGPLYGAIYDNTQSYTIVLWVTTSVFTLGTVLNMACFISFRTASRTQDKYGPGNSAQESDSVEINDNPCFNPNER